MNVSLQRSSHDKSVTANNFTLYKRQRILCDSLTSEMGCFSFSDAVRITVSILSPVKVHFDNNLSGQACRELREYIGMNFSP